MNQQITKVDSGGNLNRPDIYKVLIVDEAYIFVQEALIALRNLVVNNDNFTSQLQRMRNTVELAMANCSRIVS
jgi:hypothetical protein